MVELHDERDAAKRERFPPSVIYGALGALVLLVLALFLSVVMGESFVWFIPVLFVSVPALFAMSIAAIRKAWQQGRGWMGFFGFAAMLLAIFGALLIALIVWAWVAGSSM